VGLKRVLNVKDDVLVENEEYSNLPFLKKVKKRQMNMNRSVIGQH